MYSLPQTPPPPPVDALAEITVFFALVLALALLIERLLEVLKSLYDWVDSYYDLYHSWTRRAQKIAQKLQSRLRALEYLPPAMLRPLINRVYELLLNNQENGYFGSALVISGDLVRAGAVRLVCKLVGMGVGILIAYAFQIDLVQLWQPPAWGPLAKIATEVMQISNLRIIASGAVIGLGAGPVHKLITTLERQQAERQARPEGQG